MANEVLCGATLTLEIAERRSGEDLSHFKAVEVHVSPVALDGKPMRLPTSPEWEMMLSEFRRAVETDMTVQRFAQGVRQASARGDIKLVR